MTTGTAAHGPAISVHLARLAHGATIVVHLATATHRAAHHHGLGDLGDLLAVHVHGSARHLGATFEVKGKLGVDVHRTTADVDVAVGVERIGVALCPGGQARWLRTSAMR